MVNAFAVEDLVRRFSSFPSFTRREALRGVTLALERGETLGLVGPNGSGKTTLMRILAGTDRATSGRVEVLGGTPEDTDVRGRTGYLPEDSPFPGELGGLSALELCGTLQGMSRKSARSRGAALLERVGLGPHARVLLRRYSRGMLRRFGLAQALLHEPELLLLDEPTAGLDALGFEVLDELLREERAKGTSVLFASHVALDLVTHCDQLAVLLDGKAVACARPAELLGREGRTSLEIRGLEPEALDALTEWVAAHGGEVVARHPGGTTLVELFRAFSAP